MYVDRFRAKQHVAASPLVQSEEVVRERLANARAAARREVDARGLMGKRVLLYVGRLAREKRVDRLIDAMPRIRSHLADAVLALVGDGPDRAELEARAGNQTGNGSVIFVGRAEGDALYAWYRLGSVFALASEYEPFGAVVNEALLAGMPAVCSDQAGARVLVSEGVNGAVVNAAAPDELIAALTSWLAREPRLSTRQLDSVPPSRMLGTFTDAVDAYVAALDAARTHHIARGLTKQGGR
jgi:glycosyltransferase involved in cell wall biosynthesis